jgi:invasion protein IalB
MTLSFALVVLGTVVGNAQEVQPEWPVSCRANSLNGEGTACTIGQNISNAQGETLFRVAFQVQSGREDILLNIVAPLTIYLPDGITYSVDGNVIETFQYERCFEYGCNAFGFVSHSQLQSLLVGGSMDLIFSTAPESRQNVSIPLERFAEQWASVGF